MLTHVGKNNQPKMVGVNHKQISYRRAKARGVVDLPDEVVSCLRDGEIQSKKGPVFQTAIIAGTMAAKRTDSLIPFCHPIPLESCEFNIEVRDGNQVIIECEVSANHKTGVEMEALCAVNIAALTIYDMCKALSHRIRIKEVVLLEKSGGKSEFKRH